MKNDDMKILKPEECTPGGTFLQLGEDKYSIPNTHHILTHEETEKFANLHGGTWVWIIFKDYSDKSKEAI